MRRNPLYSFKDRSSVGISSVPLNTTLHILNDGTGKPIFVEIISKAGLTPGSTIGDFLDDPNLYVNLSEDEIAPSELEKITENGNTGWRILGRDPDNYGDIGQDAIDLSISNTPGDFGATGDNTFVTGLNNTSDTNASFVSGTGNRTFKDSQSVIGKYNKEQTVSFNHGEAQLIIGNGTQSLSGNSIEFYEDGSIYSPELDINIIENGEDKLLVTKEYADDIDGGNLT